MSDIR